MDNIREKLIELIGNMPASVDCIVAEADYLIANGVTTATDNNDGHKWIPVSERLPEEDGWYQVVAQVKDCEDPWVWYGEYDSCYGWNVKDSFSDRLTCRVTHWMPLPEPPKEE